MLAGGGCKRCELSPELQTSSPGRPGPPFDCRLVHLQVWISWIKYLSFVFYGLGERCCALRC